MCKIKTAGIEKMFAENIFELAQTERAALTVVFVLEKGGKFRTCTGYRKRNTVIEREFYLISHMDECRDKLWIETVFWR